MKALFLVSFSWITMSWMYFIIGEIQDSGWDVDLDHDQDVEASSSIGVVMWMIGTFGDDRRFDIASALLSSSLGI